MAISQYEFWFDGQQRRFIEQIVRAFSGFSYQTGMIAGQPPQTVLVPCRVASSNRMVANIVANLSENTLLSVPLITVYQTGLRGRREDLQNPGFVDTRQVYERNIVNGRYGTERGNAYSVDRIMPLPFTMDVQVDIWTSNLQQKYMLIEQILPIIYPQFEIQNSSNALDWTAVTICLVEDEMTFSSRTIPVGTTDEIDVMTIQLKLPIWLSAPAKVKRISQIEEIIATVTQGEMDPMTGQLVSGAQFAQVIVTPDDACISVDGNVITLLGAKHASLLPDGTVPSWFNLIEQYGLLSPTVSKLKLFINDDIEGAYVTGSLQYGPIVNQLLWTIDIDTLPSNTMPSINGVIDPLRSSPGNGLPAAADGQRYLIINDVGNSIAWGNLTARTNDIIEYSNNAWSVSFNSTTTVSTQYVLNTFTGRQLRWTGNAWAMSIDGAYEPGHWRLAITPMSAQGLATMTLAATSKET
jgi:hypothetical protein